MVAVDIQSPCIHTFRFLTQFKINIDVVLRNDPGTVGRTFESLFDRHSGNKVQVDVFRDIQDSLLYKECRIECNKQMAGETECFRIERDKPQINTFLSVHIQRIEQVIFVIIRSDSRQRTDKPL